MKKIFAFLAVVFLALALFACEDEPTYVTVRYTSSEGGRVDGSVTQRRQADENGIAHFDSVTAIASNGYIFKGWSDGFSEPKRTDSLTLDTVFEAIFEKKSTVTLSYVAQNGGYIIGSAQQELAPGALGEEVEACANDGYLFIGWSDGRSEAERADAPSADITYVAMFTNEVSVKYEAGEGGKIDGEASQSVIIGDFSKTVTAIADEGYRFKGWSDGVTDDARNDEGVTDTVIRAEFVKYHSVSFICDTSKGKIAGELSQTVDEGEFSTAVIVREIEGYEFVCWSNGSTNKIMSVSPTEDMTLVAHFMKKGYGLPTVFINTATGADVTSKKDYIGCTVSINDTESDFNVIEASAQIRGRGNSTWEKFPKKPYKIKFDAAQDLFGFGKAKDWVLLADYIDNALVRNYIAYSLATSFDTLSSSPNCHSVEVYLNGKYHGVYLLCEQIEINEGRVEIEESSSELDTSYLIEMDQWALDPKSDDIYVSVPDSLRRDRAYTIKSPDENITDAQLEFIRQYIEKCIAAVEGTDYGAVCELMDVKSFAQAYIVYELTCNPDINYSSFYLHKDAGGRLLCGPVWDFDMSVGNVSHKGGGVFANPEVLWSKQQNPYFKGLLKFDEFKGLVGEELSAHYDTIKGTIDGCIKYALSRQSAYEQNFERWQVLGVDTWTKPSYIKDITTWRGQIDYVVDYLDKSLKGLIKEYCAEQNSNAQ